MSFSHRWPGEMRRGSQNFVVAEAPPIRMPRYFHLTSAETRHIFQHHLRVSSEAVVQIPHEAHCPTYDLL